ncbi:hypothetical protein PC120_g14669 [Phytophthora cactorum]|nr:hypothetical protein PC120_g14669 [Phytophthora cactorum]
MALTDVILAPYAAAKDAAQSMNPVMLAALVAVVVVVNVVAAKSWQARRSRLEVPRPETGDEGNDSNAQRRGPKAHVLFCFAFP